MKIEARPLRSDEQAMLSHLLSIDFDGVEQLRRQAEQARVVGACDCGCPTIELSTGADPLQQGAFEGRLAPVEGRVMAIGDEPVADVILFVDDGRISYLELVWHSAESPSAWPPVERVELFRRSG
jgi:hypothetical protein